MPNRRPRAEGPQAECPLQFVKLAALEATANAVVITDTDGHFLWTNPAFTALTGYAADEVLGKTPAILKSGLQDDTFYRNLWTTVLRGETWRGTMVNRRKDGSRYHQDFTITPVPGPDGAPQYFIGVSQDVSEQVRLREEVERSAARSRALLRHSSDVIFLIDEGGTVLEVLDTDGLRSSPLHYVVGTQIFSDIHPEDLAHLQTKRALFLQSPGATIRVELRVRNGDRAWHWVESVSTNLLHDPSVGAIVVHRRDITERKAAEELVRHQALHDALTGLPNRTLFLDRVSVALEQARRGRARPAILYLDLDDFKEVNDRRGHAAGDAVLRTIAQRLRGIVRASDSIARWGGDEFVILLTDARSPEDAEGVARLVVATVGEPVPVEGVQVRVGTSVGVACWPEDGEDADSLLSRADAALYQAKAHAPNTVTLASGGTTEQPRSAAGTRARRAARTRRR